MKVIETDKGKEEGYLTGEKMGEGWVYEEIGTIFGK